MGRRPHFAVAEIPSGAIARRGLRQIQRLASTGPTSSRTAARLDWLRREVAREPVEAVRIRTASTLMGSQAGRAFIELQAAEDRLAAGGAWLVWIDRDD